MKISWCIGFRDSKSVHLMNAKLAEFTMALNSLFSLNSLSHSPSEFARGGIKASANPEYGMRSENHMNETTDGRRGETL